MIRHLTVSIRLVLVAVVISGCSGSNADQIELLFSSTNQSIASLHFSGQQQEVTVTNTAVLEYLNRAFHSGRGSNYQLGTTYDVEIGFTSGAHAKTAFYIHEGLDGFAVAIPRTFNDPYYFDVRFSPPTPDEVHSLMWQLENPKMPSPKKISPTNGMQRTPQ